MAVPVKSAFSPLAALGRRIRDWWDRCTALRQLSECDARDLERIVQELNVTRPELAQAVARGAYPKLLLPEMLRALGLQPDRLEAELPAVAADLRRVCAQCPETRRCRRQLDADTAASDYNAFCPNAATLDALLLLTEVAGASKQEGDQEEPFSPAAPRSAGS